MAKVAVSPMDIPEGYESVRPEIFKFEKVGDSLAGVFCGQEAPVFEEKNGVKRQVLGARYYLETAVGRRMIWGSAVLDSQMRLLMEGQEIMVRYEGEGDAKPGQSAVKLYNIFTKSL